MSKILFVILFSVNAWAMSPSDFIQKTAEHRFRVKEEMHTLFELRPDQFLHLTPDLIERYANLHDMPKITNRGISRVLSKYFGVNRRQLFGRAKTEFEDAISELNRLESAQKAEFFESIDKTAGQELGILEKVADVVDTGIFRAKELGVSFIKHDAAMFLEREGAEGVVVELAEILEEFIIVAAPAFAAA